MSWVNNFMEPREPALHVRAMPSVRPRSLFTAHSYMAGETPVTAAELYEPPETGGLYHPSVLRPVPLWTLPRKVAAAATAGRLAAHADHQLLPLPVGVQQPQPSAAGPQVEYEPVEELEPTGPMATSLGTIMLNLFDCVRVDLSLNGSVRVINFRSNIVLAISSTGTSVALIHPNGRVRQYGSRVELCTSGPNTNNKYAKMWHKGVSFTADSCALVYLVDSAGLRSTTDSFPDLSRDFSLDVFYVEAHYGPERVQECMTAIEETRYWVAEDGSEIWDIAGVRITQQIDGQVKLAVQRTNGKRLLKTSVTLGTASITTPLIHTTASMGQNPHMFVRRGERRLHYDVTNFVVRNAGHSAGFDQYGRLKVY